MTDIIIIFNIINFVCRDHFSGKGYTYPVSPNIPSAVLQDPDCEKAWYRKAPGNGSELEFLSDGQLHVNQSRHPLVVDVSEKNITITKCIELRHNVTCHGSNQKFQHLYQVTDHNATNSTITANSPNTTNPPNTTIRNIIRIIPIIIIIIIIGVLILRYRQGRRNRVLVSLRGCCKPTEAQNNNIPLKELEAGSNHEMQPLNIENPNHDHAVSADQNGDAGRMLIQDQTSESDKGPRLPSNQNKGDCATVKMNDYENDGMKKCRRSNDVVSVLIPGQSFQPALACPDTAPHIDDIITSQLYKAEEEGGEGVSSGG
ncbi:hypothetical protein Q7C36_003976 [Tachysurus vachellii]|uniref:Uncharacterized protein n=1 Tax=Tachysurus vachellii TaxID=175792 RepID=A0AA88T5G1_TACVA|nr:hypothetical protein Q7C36_003976 [Tachysurus vachellii]